MSLSQDMKTVLVPADSGITASLFSTDTTMGSIAASFLVTLPPASLSDAERQGYLRSWQSAANYVITRLYDPEEIVDEDHVVAEFRALEEMYAGVASSVLKALSGGLVQTVFRLLTQPFKNPFEVASETMRCSLLYLYTSASAGVSFHASPARGQLSKSELSQDYLLRLGAFQAIAAIARTGVLDPIARDKRTLGALPVAAVVVIIAVGIVTAAALIATVITSVYHTAAKNNLIREMQRRACEADPNHCAEITAELASRLSMPPDADEPIGSKVARYGFYAALILGGFWLLPSFLRSTGELFTERSK